MIENEQLTEPVIGAAIEVHRILGPGLLESVYERCLSRELESARHFPSTASRLLPVVYKGHAIDCDLRIDIVCFQVWYWRLKSVEKSCRSTKHSCLTYLKLSGNKIGLLINFNVSKLRDGLKRMVN